jgi:hypothetical protein
MDSVRGINRGGQIDNSWNEVSLELVQVDTEGALKVEGHGDGRDNQPDQSVQAFKARMSDIGAILADVVNTSVAESAVGLRNMVDSSWNSPMASLVDCTVMLQSVVLLTACGWVMIFREAVEPVSVWSEGVCMWTSPLTQRMAKHIRVHGLVTEALMVEGS